MSQISFMANNNHHPTSGVMI